MSSVFKDSRTDPTEGSEEEEEDSREEEERSDSASSSSNDIHDLSSSVKDIHSQDARWAQMKRNAQKKKAHKGLDRLKGLVSLQDMQRAHGLKRMQDGLRTLLSLHHPVELSSICGCLKLKVQQKANVSMNQIIKYASETEEIDELKIKIILKFMYEGALWEYLHSIGHPVHTMVLDPRDTIIDIWQKGGLLGNNSSFIPHFVAREVKKRNDWVTSKDIQKHLTAISEAQDKMKVAERKVISDHDYTHILTYFKSMSHLRSLETACREYLISELEIARSHIDSDVENIHLSRELLKDCELQFVKVAEALNKQLAHTESACMHRVQESVKLQSEIMRLNEILDTYIHAENNRQEVDGGVLAGLKLREISQCHPLVQQLARKMMSYKDVRDDHDDQLRQRSRCHVHEINTLRSQKEELEAELVSIHEYKQAQSEFVKKLMSEFVLTNRKAIKAESFSQKKIGELGKLVSKQSSKAGKLDLMIRKTKPLLVSGTRHSSDALSNLCLFLLKHFELIQSTDEENMLLENISMAKEDQRSYFAAQQRLADDDRRRRHQEQLALDTAAAKGKSKSSKGKGSKSAKLVAKSPSKSSVAAGGSTTSSRPTSKASNTKPSKPGKK